MTAPEVSRSNVEDTRKFIDDVIGPLANAPVVVADLAEEVPEIRGNVRALFPWFDAYADRVVFPLAHVLWVMTVGRQMQDEEDEAGNPEEAESEASEEDEEEVPPYDPSVFDASIVEACFPLEVLAWSVDKVAVSFDNEAFNRVFVDPDWWKGFTTDWVLEHFTPRALWIAPHFAKGTRWCTGFITGFTATESGLTLWCQPVDASWDWYPKILFEIPLEPGRTLGEVARELTFSHFAADALEAEDAKKARPGDRPWRERMTEGIRAHAAHFLPLLVAAIGDDYARECLRFDPATGKREPAGDSLPARDTDGTGGTANTGDDQALVRRLKDPTITIVKVTQQKAKVAG